MPAPLDGIKVLDLTKLAPGPFCTMILADLGAEVIKIEEPGPPTGRRAQQAAAADTRAQTNTFGSSPYNALARNKKSIGINLKSGVGKEIYTRLAQRTDVIVEEYRPGVAKRLGIDYEKLLFRATRASSIAPSPATARPVRIATSSATTSTTSRRPACSRCSGAPARRRPFRITWSPITLPAG